MTELPPILDVCCGFRGFYADKSDSRVLFGDIRAEEQQLCDGRTLRVAPDMQLDFRALPFADNSFSAVIFDPPHLLRAGKNSWLAKKYGRLDKDTWQEDLGQGFAEAFRVLRPNGCLVFKWSEKDVPLRQVLALTPEKPVIGHFGRIKYPFHWVLFMKAAPRPAIGSNINSDDYYFAQRGWGRTVRDRLPTADLSVIAAKIGIKKSSLLDKLNAVRPWRQAELQSVCNAVGDDYDSVVDFTRKGGPARRLFSSRARKGD